MKLKEAIKKTGLKHAFIAEKIGMNYSTYRYYLNDESKRPYYFEPLVYDFIKKYE